MWESFGVGICSLPYGEDIFPEQSLNSTLVRFCRVRMKLHVQVLVVKMTKKTVSGKRRKIMIHQTMEATIILWRRMVDMFTLFGKWLVGCSIAPLSNPGNDYLRVIWCPSWLNLIFNFSLLVFGVCVYLSLDVFLLLFQCGVYLFLCCIHKSSWKKWNSVSLIQGENSCFYCFYEFLIVINSVSNKSCLFEGIQV